MKNIVVQDIIGIMNKAAPEGLAMQWDNPGLQIGERTWKVKKILLTLDVTKGAIEKAIHEKADCIVSHHPLIFKPIKSINDPNLLSLIRHKISVYSAHTNLDVAKNGVNYTLAGKLGLTDLENITNETGSEWLHVTVFVPLQHSVRVRQIIAEAGGGLIGNYDQCCSENQVEGHFRPMEGSDPVLGECGKLQRVDEVKLQFFCESFRFNDIIQMIKSVHFYETPVYYAHAVKTENSTYGLGLIGKIPFTKSLKSFAADVKEKLNAPRVSLWLADKKTSDKVKTVAVCGGAGGSLLLQLNGRADVFITGDINYHAMLESKIPIIDAGHFWTEYPVLNYLETLLKPTGAEIVKFTAQEHEINKQICV
ncbi:MAG TPA: Nif3-like dinuclear metal center hexameric protein [Candidatus Cloacimonadota bacterium]|nr:Nif3-like dinuclear metal center hexameric protein [Candidatus Cloacimonadota bacterium]HPT72901.1 Nif3-like dinuclear metal center hexameric protein [Candidatus Cloacimonadota bacterium]